MKIKCMVIIYHLNMQERFLILIFFGTNASPIFGSANLNYNKPLEEFLMKDYEEIRKMIATSLNENLNKKLKEEEKRDKYTKDNIIIINIIPKKYEVLNSESD